jgi:hypothetical protein
MSDVFIASETVPSLVLHPENSHAEIALCQMGTICEMVQLSLSKVFQLVTSMKFREPSDIFMWGIKPSLRKSGHFPCPKKVIVIPSELNFPVRSPRRTGVAVLVLRICTETHELQNYKTLLCSLRTFMLKQDMFVGSLLNFMYVKVPSSCSYSS